jgi:hypothetical protein
MDNVNLNKQYYIMDNVNDDNIIDIDFGRYCDDADDFDIYQTYRNGKYKKYFDPLHRWNPTHRTRRTGKKRKTQQSIIYLV